MAESSVSKKQRPKTRASTDVFLVGHLVPRLEYPEFKQLPTAGQVLRRLYCDLKSNKLSLSTSCSNVADEILVLWNLANIPTTQKPHITDKIKALYQKHVNVGKNKQRRTERQSELESKFSYSLTLLFDIAHADCEHLLRIDEDKDFLKDQRGGRQMVMGKEDLHFKAIEERRLKRKHDELRQKERACRTETLSTSNAAPDSTTQEVDLCSETDKDDDSFEVSRYHCNRTGIGITSHSSKTTDSITPNLKKRCLIDNPMFVASLDRTRTTPREAMHIVAPALKAIGMNVDDLTLSTTSLYESRKKVRCTIEETVRETFLPNTPLVAHFDGKLLPDHDGVNSDRMPIVVSGKEIEKLLAIPKLPGSGTGVTMGRKVVEVLNQWEGVHEWLAGLCFDTTSANTGVHNGAITIIQQAFDKRLLYFACRHHIHEVIAAGVFDLFFSSSGPAIPIFGRFRDQWSSMDQGKYDPIDRNTEGYTLNELEKMWLEQNSAAVVQFLKDTLITDKQPRQDYLEFVKLSLVALGHTEQFTDGFHFSRPGAYHRARWMAKGIYSLKLLLFRKQFKMNAHEMKAVKRISLFIITLYVKAWLTSPISCDAPLNDLSLLQSMESFLEIDKEVASVALKKMKGHLWYLSQDLVALSLFSDHVHIPEKIRIVEALKTPERNDLRRLDPKTVQFFQATTLSDFVTKQSLNLFTALKLSSDFLSTDPGTWDNRDDYKQAKETVGALRVVNDCAERAVKLATDFNSVLTHDEEQRQLIFQVVEHYRKLLPVPLKKCYADSAHM